MAHRLPNRVLEATATVGTGPIALAGALPGFAAFSAGMAVGDTVHYQIVAVDVVGRPTGEWEIGRGTLTNAGTLARTTVLATSAGATALNFGAGVKYVSASIISPNIADGSELIRTDWLDSLGVDLSGLVGYFAMNSAPAGWLKANGAHISRSTYARLFARIGTTYGSGNGSTTFALPDMRGVFPRGLDDGRGIDIGRALAVYQESQNLSHAHSVYDTGHTHGAASGSNFIAGGSGPTADIMTGGGSFVLSNTSHTTTGISLYPSGGDESRPRNMALLACIRYW